MTEYNLEIWQDGMMVAGVSGSEFERVYRQAMHYQFVYGQDGPTEMRGIPIEKMGWVKSYLSGDPLPRS